MSGARDIVRNGLAQSDFDGGGHKLVNWDTSNLVFGSFGAQLANRVYAGPASGAAAIPTFRILTFDEVGAQEHSDNLDILADVTPTGPGLQFLTLDVPVTSGYTKVQKTGGGTIVSVFTAPQLRTDIEAQPLSDALSLISPLSPTFSGLGMLEIPDPVQAGYPKHNGADAGPVWSFLTPAQLAADIGAVGGGAGGAGQGDDLAYTAGADVTLAPTEQYSQWFQRVTLAEGAGDNYAVSITLAPDNAVKGAIFRILLDFEIDCIASVFLYDATDAPVLIPLRVVTGVGDEARKFAWVGEFTGSVWREFEGHWLL